MTRRARMPESRAGASSKSILREGVVEVRGDPDPAWGRAGFAPGQIRANRDELGHWTARVKDGDLLTARHPVEQPRQVRLCVVNVHLTHGTAMMDQVQEQSTERGPDPATRSAPLADAEATKAATPCARRPFVPWFALLGDRLDVAGLRALLALGHVELDLLVLVEIPVADAGDRAEVHEDVRAAVVLGDEAEALLAVEPLHGTCAHEQFPPFLPGTNLAAARRASWSE